MKLINLHIVLSCAIAHARVEINVTNSQEFNLIPPNKVYNKLYAFNIKISWIY